MTAEQLNISDAELLEAIGNKDNKAFAQLVRRHSERCYRIAWRAVMNKSEAEDIVQEAFSRIWNKPKSWDHRKQASFSTWLYRVIVNLSIDFNKKKRPETFEDEIEYVPDSGSLQKELEENELCNRVNLAISQLPERQRTALTLCLYEGMSNKQAAEIMDVNVKALESLLVRGKTALKKMLAHYRQ